MKKIISNFQKILPIERILTSPSEVEKYNKSWLKQYKGNSKIVLIPNSTEEISQILKMANKKKIKIITVSGRTSLVGGTTALNNEILLSTEKLNKFEFDSKSGILKTESGAILEKIQNKLSDQNYETPFDLGSRGSCMIGGNISTCAGGINFVKYGSLRNYVLGLEVVLGNGDVLDMMNSVEKDNTGVDLKQLFVGAEGILGVVTKVNLLCKPVQPQRKVFLLRIKGFGNVVEIVRRSKEVFCDSLQAVEYIDYESFFISCKGNDVSFFDLDDLEIYKNNVYDDFKRVKDDTKREHFLLLEIRGSDEEFLFYMIEKFLMKTEDKIFDSILADDKTKQENIWNARENLTSNLTNYGKILKYDLSLRFDLFEDIINIVQNKFHDKINMITGYGHIGDGNIHLQVIFKDGEDVEDELIKKINNFIYNYIRNIKGSISAEHGIGLLKNDYLGIQKNEIYLKYAEGIKKLFDPNNILNPGKTIKLNN